MMAIVELNCFFFLREIIILLKVHLLNLLFDLMLFDVDVKLNLLEFELRCFFLLKKLNFDFDLNLNFDFEHSLLI